MNSVHQFSGRRYIGRGNHDLVEQYNLLGHAAVAGIGLRERGVRSSREAAWSRGEGTACDNRKTETCTTNCFYQYKALTLWYNSANVIWQRDRRQLSAKVGSCFGVVVRNMRSRGQ